MSDVLSNDLRLELAPFQPIWDSPTYVFADVVEAAYVDGNALKSWLDRDLIHFGQSDSVGRGKGSSRLFTLRRVLYIAIMGELSRLGITPSRAAVIAFSVTDLHYPGDTRVKCFPKGCLVVYPLNSEEKRIPGNGGKFALLPGTDGISLQDVLSAEHNPDFGSQASLVAVDLSALLRRISKVMQMRGRPIPEHLENQ